MSKLPSNWQVKSLGEVSEVIRGITFTPNDKVEKEDKGAISCLRTTNVQFKVDWDDLIYIPRHLVKDKERLLRKGDTLISTANSKDLVGKCAFIDELKFESTLGGFISAIRPNQKYIYPSFLFHYLTQASVRAYLKKVSRQTTNIANLSIPDLLNLRIPLPPLPIQKQIAEILEKADQAKQKRKEANKLTDEFLQSVFIEMFGDPVKNPKGWRKDELKSIAIIERDSVTSENLGKADLYIGLEHIEKESGKLLGFEYVNEIDLKSNKFKFTSEHVLYGKLRPYLNKVCLPNFNGVCSTDIIPIKPRQNISDKYFLAFLMRMDFFVKEATIKSAGANLPRISPNILEKFKVYVPPLSLQQQFAEIVNKTEALKEKQKQSEQELENLFQSLMQKAFKGELVA